MPSSYYEIRVAGTLPPEALLDFERLTASVEPVETVVVTLRESALYAVRAGITTPEEMGRVVLAREID